MSEFVALSASFTLVRMLASERITMLWVSAFGALSMSVCQPQRLHLARTLECKLISFVVHAARATAYIGNGAPFLIVDWEVAGRVEDCDEIATMILWAVPLFSVWSLLALSSKLIEECLMLLTRFSRLLIMRWRVTLAPIKRLLIMVEVSDVIVLSDRSVSRMEMEQIASSSVFGILWASVM